MADFSKNNNEAVPSRLLLEALQKFYIYKKIYEFSDNGGDNIVPRWLVRIELDSWCSPFEGRFQLTLRYSENDETIRDVYIKVVDDGEIIVTDNDTKGRSYYLEYDNALEHKQNRHIKESQKTINYYEELLSKEKEKLEKLKNARIDT